MSSVWALQDAKNRFSAVIERACQVEPQIVTRRGTPVAVLISYETYKAGEPKKRTFVEALLGGPKIEGGLAIRRDKSSLRQMELA